jgi:glycosyltransferase involved in cell wall biosynthesis
MNVTVILCTHDRCQSLAKTLESLAVSSLPEAVEWEILVVDNNSKDETEGVVREFCELYPGRFRYLREPRAGKSNALNAGIREAKGDVLAFTDDDVTVESTWLRNLTASLHDGRWAGAGGRTLPERNFSPPRWLSPEGRHALAPLAIFDRGMEIGELTESPIGNNMAYRRTVFEKHGVFRNDLGPRPGCGGPQKSEDSEFGVRVRAAGERLRYEPSAVLYHSIPASRVKKEYFLAWWFDKARADARAFGIPRDTDWFLAGIPLYLFPRLAIWSLRWICSPRPAWRFSCKINVWAILGQIKECYRMWRKSKGTKRETSPMV